MEQQAHLNLLRSNENDKSTELRSLKNRFAGDREHNIDETKKLLDENITKLHLMNSDLRKVMLDELNCTGVCPLCDSNVGKCPKMNPDHLVTF